MAHLPPLKMEKHYYKPHIEDIKRRLAEARALGAPSVEEWMKGLTSEGKERHDDAVRWEQWEARGGLKKVNAKPPVKHSTPAPSKPILHHKAEDHSSRSTPHNLQLPAKPPVDLGTSPVAPGMGRLCWQFHLPLADLLCSSLSALMGADNWLSRCICPASSRCFLSPSPRAKYQGCQRSQSHSESRD